MRWLLHDLRDASRTLRRDRGFAIAVIFTLALTIGATTAAFSLVNGVLLKPLPFPASQQLVSLREIWIEVADRIPTLEVNERHFEHWRQNAKTFAAMAQYIVLPANLTSRGPATQIRVARTSGSLFDVLGHTTVLGRPLTDEDDRAGAPEVVVLGDALWRQRFGGDPAVLGTMLVLDGAPFAIVGVLPPQFRLPGRAELLADVDAVVPLRLQAGWAGDHNNLAVGRLAAGASIDRARAELAVLQQQAGAIATAESGQTVTLAGVITPLQDSIVGRSRRGLWLLFAAIVAVLAIACSNLTNLALIRALARARDVSIRSALGAGRLRLVGRAVMEHALLASIGGALGLWIAYGALQLFVLTAPVDLPRLEEAAIDFRVVLFAILTTGVTTVLVSLLPVWHVGSGDPQVVLRGGGDRAGQGPCGLRARTFLTALQIAVSVTLLTVTALLGASLLRVLDIDYGFNAERVVAVPVAMPAARYPDDATRIAAHDRIVEAVRALPGVSAAASTSLLPMRGEGQVNFVTAAGDTLPRAEWPSANFRFVTPEFFTALELPLQRGHMFTAADRRRATMPAVVSQPLASRLWPGADPIGKIFSRGIDGEAGFAVVGVAADARTTSLEGTPPLMVYVPYWWRPRPALSLVVKTAMDPSTLMPAVRRVIAGIDPEIAVGQSRLMEHIVAGALAGRRYQARLFVVFGVLSLLIASLGVYTVTAYGLSKRRREMNIRVAFGARRADVLGLLMGQSLKALLPGLAAGVAGALAIGGITASLLYEVRPGDPGLLAAVVLVVGVAALGASLLATRNGLSLYPAAALRDE